jgi:OmpA-OmpF porin, OOP family
LVACCVGCVTGLLTAAQAQGAAADELTEAAGAQDHPAMSRFKGSTLIATSDVPFESVRVALGPISGFDHQAKQLKLSKQDIVEGRVQRYLYIAPASTTALEVTRNYEQALGQNGFSRLYSCGPTDCGSARPASLYDSSLPAANAAQRGRARFTGDPSSYLVAKGGTVAAPLWALVMIGQYKRSGHPADGRTAIYHLMIQPKAAALGQVAVDAAALSAALGKDGKVALYGLYFDTNSATLKPESLPQLEELAKWLKAEPQRNVIVVGHTDSQGGLEPNVQLSERRAAAVAKALSDTQGVAASRLSAKGVGMLAPVASNRDEAGRAKNRRVEIIER